MCIFSLRNPACKAHAPYYIVIFDLHGAVLYLHTLSQKWRDFRKTVTEQKMFSLSLYFVSETFFNLRRNERDIIEKIAGGLNVNYPLFLSDLNEP